MYNLLCLCYVRTEKQQILTLPRKPTTDVENRQEYNEYSIIAQNKFHFLMQISDEYFSSKVHTFDDLCHVFRGGGWLVPFQLLFPSPKLTKSQSPIFLWEAFGLWTKVRKAPSWEYGTFWAQEQKLERRPNRLPKKISGTSGFFQFLSKRPPPPPDLLQYSILLRRKTINLTAWYSKTFII